ncbi:MAG: 50S ribosomal protein L9 [Candidatus Puniceispirillales bacterium]
MNIILTEKINKLGKLGDTVNVKDGYARNFLLPQGKAIRATKENLDIFSEEKSKREAENEIKKTEAEKLSESIKNTSIVILRPASETGQLYGSVSTRNIANEVLDKGFSITHKQIVLKKTIKELGLQKIDISLHPEVSVEIKLNIARSIEEAKIQEKTGEAIIDRKFSDDNSNVLNDDANRLDKPSSEKI